MSVPIYPLSNSCAAYIKCSPFRLLLSIYIHLSSLLLLLSCPTSILILRCLDPNIYLKSFIKSYTNVMSISLTPCTTFNPSISHHVFYTQSLSIDNHMAISQHVLPMVNLIIPYFPLITLHTHLHPDFQNLMGTFPTCSST
jgi:hypothetical protein